MTVLCDGVPLLNSASYHQWAVAALGILRWRDFMYEYRHRKFSTSLPGFMRWLNESDWQAEYDRRTLLRVSYESCNNNNLLIGA